MCDPVTALVVGGMVASGAGTYLQSREQNKNAKRAMNAKNKAYSEGMERQNQYAEDASASARKMVDKQGAQAFNDDMSGAVEKRLQAFNDNRIAAPDYSILTGSPKNVVMAQEQAFGDSESKRRRDTGNLAQLSGYGDTMFGSGLARNEYARQFGNLADKAGRDSNLIQLDMSSAANNAIKAPSLFPTLLKTAGTAATIYGAAGAPGWASTTAAPPSPDFIGPMPQNPGFGAKLNNAFGGFF